MTYKDIVESIAVDAEPPAALSAELKSLWLAKKGEWHASHDICQDIPTKLGSWIHALLHTIEGDLGNAGYWYARAGEPAIDMDGIDDEWERIVRHALSAA